MSSLDRRSFLARGAAAAGAAAVSGSLFQTFNLAGASPAPARGGQGSRGGYGPVSRTARCNPSASRRAR